MKIQYESWKNKLQEMAGPWSSKNLVQSTNGIFKLRVMEKYEAPWHEHYASDEVFIVLSGRLEIDLEEETHIVVAGQIFLVPSVTKHRARAEERVEILIYDEIRKEGP